MSGPPARPLRVVVAHNRYQQRGGEDAVVEAEVALLRHHGHDVVEYRRHNDEIDALPRAGVAMQTLWSRRTVADIERIVDDHTPDVIHVHNTFPLISPSIYWAASRRRVPVVQTLHNFRLVCPQALMLRDGRPCEDCVGRVPWRAVAHRCYRDSAAQSAVLAAMVATHRAAGTWQRRIARYIALNDFCRDRFVAGGLPRAKLTVKPNFVDVPAASDADAPRDGFLFVGRLAVEKGVHVLADAWRRLPPSAPPLHVVGTGPLDAALRGVPGVQLLGALAADDVYAWMRRSAALLLPSIWYENFPRTLVEAFACGLPAIASRIGALPSLIDDGRTGQLFDAGSADALAAAVAAATPDHLAAMGAAARAHHAAHWTGDVNHRRLIAIYDEAIGAA